MRRRADVSNVPQSTWSPDIARPARKNEYQRVYSTNHNDKWVATPSAHVFTTPTGASLGLVEEGKSHSTERLHQSEHKKKGM